MPLEKTIPEKERQVAQPAPTNTWHNDLLNLTAHADKLTPQLTQSTHDTALAACVMLGLGGDEPTGTDVLLARLLQADADKPCLPMPVCGGAIHHLAVQVRRLRGNDCAFMFAGWCPECGERCYVPASAKYCVCTCGRVLDVEVLRAGLMACQMAGGVR